MPGSMRRSRLSDTPFREPSPSTKRHYSRPDPDMTDEELEAWAADFADAILGTANEGEVTLDDGLA